MTRHSCSRSAPCPPARTPEKQKPEEGSGERGAGEGGVGREGGGGGEAIAHVGPIVLGPLENPGSRPMCHGMRTSGVILLWRATGRPNVRTACISAPHSTSTLARSQGPVPLAREPGQKAEGAGGGLERGWERRRGSREHALVVAAARLRVHHGVANHLHFQVRLVLPRPLFWQSVRRALHALIRFTFYTTQTQIHT